MSPIKFGTDGWRAIIARDFTFHNVALCAQGVANYLQQERLANRGLVVGYDTRFASDEFAKEVTQVLAGNGIKTSLADRPSPTPVVSYNIIPLRAAGAAVITASHNPPMWNGFKYKPEYAGSASPEVVSRLEEEIEKASKSGVKSLPFETARAQGLIVNLEPMSAYVNHVSTLVDLQNIKQAGLRVAVDAMYGAGAGYVPTFIGGGSTNVAEIHGHRNPVFPGLAQPEPVARNLQELSALVKESRADVGIALDGDADRLGVVDEHGQFISTLHVLALLSLYYLDVRKEKGPIVKTVTSTDMLFRLGELYDVPVLETAVGFKYVGPVMMRNNALLGGEESGGYAFRGHIPERDGVLSALYLLDLMVRTGKRPSQLVEYLFTKVGPHFYDRKDVHFKAEERKRLEEKLAGLKPSSLAGERVTQTDQIDGKRIRTAKGWAIMRFSGTEPLLRIYAEAGSPELVNRMLNEAAALLGL